VRIEILISRDCPVTTAR